MNNYQIVYDIQKDMWNWREALKNSFMGCNLIYNLNNNNDLEIAKQILKLKKQPSELILKPYLLIQKEDSNSKLNKFIKIIQKDFTEKYQKACKILEKITGHPLMSNNFIFYITTFPRCPYFYENREVFIYYSIEDFWGMPTDTFLHEGLHFQFIHYWYKNKKSPVSKLKYENFDYLKEALTIVLDDDIKPIITKTDKGYPTQAKYRKLLQQHWQKHHNFEKLIEYGLSKLDAFLK